MFTTLRGIAIAACALILAINVTVGVGSMLTENPGGSVNVAGYGQRCSCRDCESKNCFSVPSSNPAQCRHFDDYLFSDDCQCIDLASWTCTVSEQDDCYDILTCTKKEGTACNANDECDDAGHLNCTTQTVRGYEECEELYTPS